MINTGLIGNGYWGKIIQSKLDKLSNLIFIQSSTNYDPSVFSKVDWIFIATPTKTHFSIVKDCLAQGKNVFVEKPFCSNLNEALELVSLFNKSNSKLYVNNLFLERKEMLFFTKNNYREICFKWHKPGPFNDNIFNDLLYHDLYILIHKLGFQNITKINSFKNNFNNLLISFLFGTCKVKLDYKRRLDLIKNKTISIDNHDICFLNTDDDPLSKIIKGCLNNNINFNDNQNINLHTMKLLDLLKKSC